VLNNFVVSATAVVDGEEKVYNGTLSGEEEERKVILASYDLSESEKVQNDDDSSGNNNNDTENNPSPSPNDDAKAGVDSTSNNIANSGDSNSRESEKVEQGGSINTNHTKIDSEPSPDDDLNTKIHKSENLTGSDEGQHGDSNNKNSSSVDNNTETDKESSPNNDSNEVMSSEGELVGSSGKTAKAKKLEVEKKKTMEGSIVVNSPLAENASGSVEDLISPSSKKRLVIEEVLPKKTEMGDPAKSQRVKNKGGGGVDDSTSSSSSLENTSQSKPQEVKKERDIDIDINVNAAEVDEEEEEEKPDSSSEKIAKSETAEIEEKEDIRRDESSPIVKGGAASDNGSADSLKENAEVQKNATMEHDKVDNPIESQEDPQKEEGKEQNDGTTESGQYNNGTAEAVKDFSVIKESAEGNDTTAETVEDVDATTGTAGSNDATAETVEDVDATTGTAGSNDATTGTAGSNDATAETAKDNDATTDTAEGNASASKAQTNEAEKKENEYPTYESGNSNDDSVIDLDFDSDLESEALKKTSAQETTAEDQAEDDDIDTSNLLINEKHNNDTSNVLTNEKENDDAIVGVNEKARARALLRRDRNAGSPNIPNTTVGKIPSTIATEGYRGEPWGQYRSTRRLPDMELLQLVFENAKKGENNRGNGDRKSQQVLKDWQKDPLYDESITKEGISMGEPSIVEENDQQFMEYRARLLSGNDADAGTDSANNNNTNDDNGTNDKNIDKSNDETNDKNNNNNVGANAEFVEGLDDIDDFFEGVDPPDELDTGYGSSIQDVLMDKGKHILLKRGRGAARWIRIGWGRIVRDLEDRISQFQLPLQKTQGTTKTAATPDLDSGAAQSSSTTASNKNEGRGVTETEPGAEAGIKETVVSAWKTGKRAFVQMSDWVDRFLDRFDKSGDDSTNFDDFNGFDLDNLSKFTPPS